MSHDSKRIAVSLAAALFGSGAACSLILQEQTLPCGSDADCARYSGSHCDLSQRQCVAGNPVSAGPDSRAADVGHPEAESEAPPEEAANVGAESADGGEVADSSGGMDSTADAPVEAAEAGEAEAGPPEPDWNALQKYLDSLFDSTQSLFRAFPGANMYRTSNDNALALRALPYLPHPEDTTRAAVAARLDHLEVCGCRDSPGHSALKNHFMDPIVMKGASISSTPPGPCTVVPFDTTSGATCSHAVVVPDAAPLCPVALVLHDDHPAGGVSPDQCNVGCGTIPDSGWGAPGMGMGSAEVIALEILSYRNLGASSTAIDALWQNLLGKWDTVGLRDARAEGTSQYAVADLALFKIVARVLEHPLPAGVDATLAAAQGTNGGIRIAYNRMGVFVDQIGTIEATALVAIAYRTPVTDF
jgi:hypothetical protein